MRLILPVILAGFLNILLIPLIIVVARKKHWYDKPDPRKIHTGNTSRLGGVGIFWSLILALLIITFITPEYSIELLRFWPIIIAMLIVHLLGLLDDFKDLRARLRLLVQLTAAILVSALGYRFSHVWLPGLGSVELGFLSWPLTMFWIVGVLNALNMIDGMDGLSGGVSLISALGLGIIMLTNQAFYPALIAFSLVGSLLGYLVFNFPPAKIFMGDSGSTFLGFSLAVLPLLDTGNAHHGLWFCGAVTLLLIPIYDVFAAMLRRKRNRVSVLSPDKWHLHHKLMYFKLSTKRILAIVYSLCVLSTLAAISIIWLPPFFYWIVIISVWIVIAGFFIVLHYAKERSIIRNLG